MEQTQKLKEWLATCRDIVAFTGAGISAESGIPTYRGEDGYWQTYDPAKYADIDYFMKDPSYYWRFFKEVRYPALKKAFPNKAHIFLAKLADTDRLNAIITQNIDGLHQQAGSRHVLELHGSTRAFICLGCGAVFDLETVYDMLGRALPPKCPECRGLVRPKVVFFGEALPVSVLQQAQEAAAGADLFLVVGSSLVVQPAASLPLIAKDNGAKLVILNVDPTPLDTLADLVVNDRAVKVLEGMA